MEDINYAKQFHDLYEKYAPDFGYETRKDTKQFDPETPNGRLMTKVCNEVISQALAERDEEIHAKYYKGILAYADTYTANPDEVKVWIERDKLLELLSTLNNK